ncbi:AAA family ATPase [Bartonella sp. HY038]|uniref:AAA family ATPase n=1 Tax=Bartonella sp. HY038 TaxID=2759660 RepID=UPI0015F79F42|nr:AAA family ATPase [Bartonella sp. HY038]
MHLESLTIKNYRKFGTENNKIEFVHASLLHASETNIAQSSTLVIGKNNTGKTTITNALSYLASSNSTRLKSSDFNVSYLKDLIKKYSAFYETAEPTPPQLEFTVQVAIGQNEQQNYITHIAPFLSINDNLDEDITVDIIIRYQVKDTQKFNKIFFEKLLTLKSATAKDDDESNKIDLEYQQFEELCKLIDDDANEFERTYHNKNGVEVSNFLLSNLICIKNIAANRDMAGAILSKKFHEIFLLFIKKEKRENSNQIKPVDEEVLKINKIVKNYIREIEKKVQNIVSKIASQNHVDLKLEGNVTTDALWRDMIKYIFRDGEDFIPENQFGLGYINLITIVAEIIHYIDSYEKDSHQSRLNLFIIEEPEVFMHPQMQEFFIKRIDNAVAKALSFSDKKPELQFQIIITTHSSHVVNSKIHSSNSFNNINYLTNHGKFAMSIPLCDTIIETEMESSGKTNDEKEAENNFKFLKKHIKYKASELFFADAVIFVEGATEETYLQHYLAQDDELKKHYISVFRIDGSHAKVYLPLIKLLQIPCLIITDLDITRERWERSQATKADIDDGKTNEYKQLDDLTDHVTSNETLKSFFNDKSGKLPYDNYHEDGNLCVVFQKDKISDYYATSLEEAIILTNSDNPLLQETLKEIKPNIYKEIVGDSTSPSTLLEAHSFELYDKLHINKEKSKFMGTFLYKILTTEPTKPPKLPQYIEDGFKWINDKLTVGNGGEKIVN